MAKDHQFDMMNVKNIPKGKISIVVVLTLLNNHKLYPDTWTAKKIAVEYHLEQQDVNSLLKYFVTFEVKNLPPQRQESNTIKMKRILTGLFLSSSPCPVYFPHLWHVKLPIVLSSLLVRACYL